MQQEDNVADMRAAKIWCVCECARACARAFKDNLDMEHKPSKTTVRLVCSCLTPQMK